MGTFEFHSVFLTLTLTGPCIIMICQLDQCQSMHCRHNICCVYCKFMTHDIDQSNVCSPRGTVHTRATRPRNHDHHVTMRPRCTIEYVTRHVLNMKLHVLRTRVNDTFSWHREAPVRVSCGRSPNWGGCTRLAARLGLKRSVPRTYSVR